MGKCFVMFAMKRSGQHGVINWICSQSRPSIHYNNCDWHKKDRWIANSPHIYPSDGGERAPAPEDIPPYDFEVAMFNFEDRPLGDIRERFMKEYSEYGEDDFTWIVLIRDPYNLNASRKRDRKKVNHVVYREHMKLVLNDSSIVPINFNAWFSNKKYRKKLAKRLGIKFTDEGLNGIIHPGNSSFDGKQYDGKAQQMNVLDRWRGVDQTYIKNMDKDIKEFAKDYFGMEVE